MKKMYHDAAKDVPPNDLPPIVKPIQVSCFVYSDHTSENISRYYQYNIIIYCNKAPLVYYCNSQATVESSIFSSEFVALWVALELIIYLH